MTDINSNEELMGVFFEEAQNLIDEMRGNISILSQGQETRDEISCSSNGPLEPSQATLLEQSAVLRRLFRCAHVIKSSSASVGLDELNKVASTLEKVFRKFSDERLVVTADVISLISESVEVCQKLLNKEEIAGCEKLLDRLNNILQP